ncbi:MAG: alpha/beta fold hydrolase [Burkholderiales bacterium]
MDSLQPSQLVRQLDAIAEHRSAPFSEGRSMHWRIFGHGEPLVLVHGGHGSWLHWVRNIEQLSRHRRLLVPDLPGFGDSDDPPEGSDLQYIVEAFIASLDQLLGARSPVDLAGFSLGGIVSALAAAKRGAVRKLALLGSPGTGTPRRTRAEMIRWRQTDESKADEAAQNAALKHNLLAHMMHDETNVDALGFEAYVTAVKRTRYHTRGVGSRSSLSSILAEYTDPVLFVYGEHDVTGTPGLAEEVLIASAANREFRLIRDGGHWIQYERAEAVNEVLTRWFAG